MSRLPTIAAAVVAALLAGDAGARPLAGAVTEGPAEWLAGAPGKDHAARAYPQYAQQAPTAPIKFMSVATLMGRLRLGDTPLIVDVRPYPEYAAARLPNAVSIPLPDVEKRLPEFPRQGTIVLY